jgi:transposase InsO family protein
MTDQETALRELLAKRVATLMKQMPIEALYPRPTPPSRRCHKVYPCLLRKLPVTQSNHFLATDITYIPIVRGCVYLAAVVDWFSRRVLSWRLFITVQAASCIETVEEASARFGASAIFDTDQGSQFIIIDFTKVLHQNQHGRPRRLARKCLRREDALLTQHVAVLLLALKPVSSAKWRRRSPSWPS